MNNTTCIIEALIFASGDGIKRKFILETLPELTKEDVDLAVSELHIKYGNESGVILLEFNDKLQFCTNAAYSISVEEALKPQKEKALTDKVIAVLAIIAYKQPITRLEIEEIRGASPDYALDVLLRSNLVCVLGRKKDVLGKPIIYGTTEYFLKRFELKSLKELPNKKQIDKKLKLIKTDYQSQRDLFNAQGTIQEDEISDLEKLVDADPLSEVDEKISEEVVCDTIEQTQEENESQAVDEIETVEEQENDFDNQEGNLSNEDEPLDLNDEADDDSDDDSDDE